MAADEAVTLLYSVIEGAAHGAGATVENVRVNLRGLDILVAEQLLNCADVVAGFEQVGGKTVDEMPQTTVVDILPIGL
ncbi:MAG: hypothetical protein BroJett021_13860 [Chloroflexota bacterium]|nr:MAG: hypothetical protein BroJett021_13860 [Chloroflexota bacterium]